MTPEHAQLRAKHALQTLLRPDARDGHGDPLYWSEGQRREFRETIDDLVFALNMEQQFCIQTAAVDGARCLDDLAPLFNGDDHG